MSETIDIPKAYDPSEVEDRWYARWEQDGCFAGKPAESQPTYSIVIPPPNVTGVLHMGHVLNNTIQDILARKARMDGKEVLWLPGTDHAGIATQNVVERSLRKQGVMKHRDDLGREALLGHIWEWKEKHGGIIIEQLKKLERLKTRADERDPVTVGDYLSRVARVGDAEVVGVLRVSLFDQHQANFVSGDPFVEDARGRVLDAGIAGDDPIAIRQGHFVAGKRKEPQV